MSENLPATIEPTVTPFRNQHWYKELVDDCQGTITEGIFAHRWALVKVYHDVGTRIIEEAENFDRAKIYGRNIVQNLAKSIGRSTRWIYYAIAVAEEWPDINDVPDGKNVSMNKLITKYLTPPKDAPPKPITYYNGLGEAVNHGRFWQVNLPLGEDIGLEEKALIVHIVIKERP